MQQLGFEKILKVRLNPMSKDTSKNIVGKQVIGLIRRTYPKKTDWALISQSDLDIIQHKLNHRPRKCLNFLSPHEAYGALAA